MAFVALTCSSAASLAAAPRLAVSCSAQPASSQNAGPLPVSLAAKAGRGDSLLSVMPSVPLTWSQSSSTALTPNATLDPSAAFANMMWAAASKTFNTQILVGDTESTESVVRRFKKACLEANIVSECRRRRYFETKQDITKRKQKEAARNRKRFQRSSGPRPNFFANKDKSEPAKAAPVENDDDAEWNAMDV